MNCLNPIPVWRDRLRRSKNGGMLLHFKPPMEIPVSSLSPSGDTLTVSPDFVVPCGKCILCRHERTKEWIRRLKLEAFDKPSSFLTLTYNDSHLEDCNKRAVQLFLKRFRQLSRKGLDLHDFKYFFVSEYGHNTGRPHYHAILFGVDLLRDPFFQSYIATSKRDKHGRVFPVYSSAILASCWDNGFVSLDRCTSQNIKYVAKYVSKNIGGSKNLFHLHSRRLGTSLFINGDTLLPFAKSTFSSGRLLIDRDSPPCRAPRFLDYYTRKYDPSLYDAVKSFRKAFSKNFKQDVEVIRGCASNILSQLKTAQRNEII